jgi:hypothetical protein
LRIPVSGSHNSDKKRLTPVIPGLPEMRPTFIKARVDAIGGQWADSWHAICTFTIKNGRFKLAAGIPIK